MIPIKTPFADYESLRIALAVDDTRQAKDTAEQLLSQVQFADADAADVLIAIGGDGFMLHQFRHMAEQANRLPIYGINAGSVGFLLNHSHSDNIVGHIKSAVARDLYPLIIKAKSEGGKEITAMAFNELSLFRNSQQAAHIGIMIDGTNRLDTMICDGLLLATPAGSTAYNSACGGAILPIGSDVLALTPISVFRPRRWRGAILSNRANIHLQIQDPQKRPVAAAVDGKSLGAISEVEVCEDRSFCLSVLFDPNESLDERIFKEQFMS